MIIPQHREQIVRFLRDLADAIGAGETQFRAFRITPSVEHRILPGGEIECDAFNMTAELQIVVESQKDYDRLKRGEVLAREMEDAAFHSGLRNPHGTTT